MRGIKARKLRKRTGFHPHTMERVIQAHEYPRKIKRRVALDKVIEIDIVRKTYYNIPGSPRRLYQNEKKL